VGEHCIHTAGVTGSNPVSPTFRCRAPHLFAAISWDLDVLQESLRHGSDRIPALIDQDQSTRTRALATYRENRLSPRPGYSIHVSPDRCHPERTSRPTKVELQAAVVNTVPDVIVPGLAVLFVGINPGLYSAAVGHHFARPGNRFWPALYDAGFTPRLLRPEEDGELPVWGLGVTNLVSRTTAAAAELTPEELRRGRVILEEKIINYAPSWTAFVGIGAYATAFSRRKVMLGPQEEAIGVSRVWVLPNTSGLNAHYTPARFAEVFAELRLAAFGDVGD
jgi:TDG/mug DNA glycosylase family protein